MIEADGTGSANTTFHWTQGETDGSAGGAIYSRPGRRVVSGTVSNVPAGRDSRGVDAEGHDDYATEVTRSAQSNGIIVTVQSPSIADGGGETRRRIRVDNPPADDRRRYAALERPAVIRRVLGLADELRLDRS